MPRLDLAKWTFLTRPTHLSHQNMKQFQTVNYITYIIKRQNKHRLSYHKAHPNISTKTKDTALGNNVNNVKTPENHNLPGPTMAKSHISEKNVQLFSSLPSLYKSLKHAKIYTQNNLIVRCAFHNINHFVYNTYEV